MVIHTQRLILTQFKHALDHPQANPQITAQENLGIACHTLLLLLTINTLILADNLQNDLLRHQVQRSVRTEVFALDSTSAAALKSDLLIITLILQIGR